mgnify:CR=1 FL=1
MINQWSSDKMHASYRTVQMRKEQWTPGSARWTPAKDLKVTKLKPAGPKPGQSVNSYLYGKTKGHEEEMDKDMGRYRYRNGRKP